MCILVVDSEPLILRNAVEGLQNAGHEVITAKNASIALDLIRGQPTYFTCLIIDYFMLDRPNGADLIEMMRARHPALPIIMTTAMDYARPTAWLHQHRVDLLLKPYSLSRLIGLVDQRLRNASDEQR